MNIKELESKINKLQSEIDECKQAINKKKDALHLKADVSDYLSIYYKKSMIGYISNKGECYILSSHPQLEAYKQWRKDGMPVDSTKVTWRGKEYFIDERHVLLYCVTFNTAIYDIDDCNYISECEDDNIIRHKHNNRPVGF